MKIRAVVLAAIVFVAGTGVWVGAQFGGERRIEPPITVMGEDVGFRIEAYRGDSVLGTLVVKVNGKWVDANKGGGLHPLTNR